MGMRHKGLAQATRALWTPLPHGGGHLGSAGVRRGHVLLQPIKPRKRNRFMCYDPRGGKVLISVGL